MDTPDVPCFLSWLSYHYVMSRIPSHHLVDTNVLCKHKWVVNDMKVYAGLITEEEATEATPVPETIQPAVSSTRRRATRPRRRLIGNLPDAPFYRVGNRIYARDEVINTNPAVRTRRRRTRRVTVDNQLMNQCDLINSSLRYQDNNNHSHNTQSQHLKMNK